MRTVGILLITAAMVLAAGGSKAKGKEVDWQNILLCLLIFLCDGFTSILSKMHQIETSLDTVSSGSFAVLSSLIRGILLGAILLCLPRKKEQEKKRSAEFAVVRNSGGSGGVSYLFQLIGAAQLPATVLYPMITGGTIIPTTLADRVVFREKLSVRLYIAVGICFAATLLLL